MTVLSRQPFIKRIPQQLNYRAEITTYDADNLYPQRVEEIMFRSAITNSGIERIADFVNGDGFENGDVILNDKGQTANDILRIISYDVAKFSSGFAMHVNWNLLGEITDITPLKFRYVRYGLPDDMGVHHDVKVNVNWEMATGILPRNQRNIIWTYPLFDPEFKNEDFEDNFNGQVLYHIPDPNIYPRATFDSVLDSSQTSGEIQVFELGNIQNGFLGSSIFKHPGEFESDDARRAFKKDLKEFQGAQNANSIMLLEMKDIEEDVTLVEQLNAVNMDRLFELTNKNVNNRIAQAIAVPNAILGIFPETGMFNQQDFEDAYVWMNIRTQNLRRIVERVFNQKIGAHWHQGEIDFGQIITQQYGAETNNTV